ncbi:MAG: signal peptide peptidase SppA [Acidobacteria bacterium]|nr:signal peptide peptidase SppA [Acidobacteriota bacterium]
MSAKSSWIVRAFRSFWRTVDRARRLTVNFLFLVVVLVVLVALFAGGESPVPHAGALILRPEGEIVDQLAGNPVDRALGQLQGTALGETLLTDLLDVLDHAREDDRIKVLVLDLDALGGVGLSKLQELRRGIEAFKASGKKVIATAEVYDRTRYYLAATADEIFLDDSGLILPTGFSVYRAYFKDALDRFGVDANVLRVGEFKTAVEPFLRDDMSAEAREANLDWLGDLWRVWLEDVAEMRGMDVDSIRGFVDQYGEHVREAKGNSVEAALAAGWIDHAAPRYAAEERVAEILEWKEDEAFPQVSHGDYLASLHRPLPPTPGFGEAVGVLVAKGTIVDGEEDPGGIGSATLTRLIRQARTDDAIKAVVLRVDSGGGSALASEVIRRELQRVRDAGKPVVVSMGSIAASGGYWISTASDEIWASPSTITGSIGIFALFPTIQKPLAEYLGVRVDGVGTSPLAGALRIDREMSPELRDVLTQWLERGYRDFLERVAAAREMPVEEVDAIARGRVWSGEDAERLGLVDHLGDLDDAIAAAARRAGLKEEPEVRWLEEQPSFRERILLDLLSAGARLGVSRPETGGPLAELDRAVARASSLARQLNDPAGLYAHCLCEVE